jgi:hypothetical protein
MDDTPIKGMIRTILSNKNIFYANIDSFYRKNIFQDIDGERAISAGFNEYNCRYNACLLYCINTYCRDKPVDSDTLNTLSEGGDYTKFYKFVISVFSLPFFQDTDNRSEDELKKTYGQHSKYVDGKQHLCVLWANNKQGNLVADHMLNIINIQGTLYIVDAWGEQGKNRSYTVEKVIGDPVEILSDKYREVKIIFTFPYEEMDSIIGVSDILQELEKVPEIKDIYDDPSFIDNTKGGKKITIKRKKRRKRRKNKTKRFSGKRASLSATRY